MQEPDWAETGIPAKDIPDAKRYWRTIIDELTNQQTLAEANRHAIIRLVQAYLTYEDAQERVNRDGPIIEAPKTKAKMQHPALSIANKQQQIIRQLEGDLGIQVLKRATAAKGKKPARKKADSGLKL
jgi:P27 family predicted phage terminase small subunit